MPDIQISYFDQLPLSYQAVITELFTKLDSDPDAENQKRHLSEFSKKYTMIPELWQFYVRIETDPIKQEEILLASLSHFVTTWAAELLPSKMPKHFKGFTWNKMNELENKIYPIFLNTTRPLKQKEAKLAKFLSFPHKHLFLVYKLYEEISGHIISNEVNEIYMKNVQIYQKLKEYYANDSIKFLDTVMEVENFDSKWSNIELLLGSRPYDADLWKKYFKIVEEESNDEKKLLKVYRRYLGLFLDDTDIQQKVHQLSQLTDSKKPPTPAPSEKVVPEPPNPMDLKSVISNFSFETAKFQPLPFKRPLSHYIFENANPQVMFKLQMSTKHFLCCLPMIIIHRLEISGESKKFYKNALSVPGKNKLFKKLNNIALTNSLFLDDVKAAKLIPKISCCDLKYLRIHLQNLLLKEYEFFVQSGKIELLSIHNVIDENDQIVPLEALLSSPPNIMYLNFFDDPLTPETFQKLLKLKFESKILFLSFSDVFQIIDVPSCVAFFKQNLGPHARIYIEFADNYPENDFHLLFAALDKMKDEWEPADEKPFIDLFLRALFI